MSSPGNSSDLLWAFFAFAAVMAWVVHRITDRPQVLGPRDQRQVAGHQGTNTYDSSSHTTTTITVDKIHVGPLSSERPKS